MSDGRVVPRRESCRASAVAAVVTCVAMLAAVAACAAPPPVTAVPAPSVETRAVAAGWGEGSSWRDQHEQICRIGADREVDVVLLGDSITQGFGGPGRRVASPGQEAFDRWLAPRRAANFGISGDRTQHLLWRIDHGAFERVRPRVVALLIGTNNLSAGDAPVDAAAGVAAIVDRLAALPRPPRVLLFALFPRGADAADPVRGRVAELNQRLSRVAAERHARFLDLAGLFLLADGRANREHLAGDFLHLTAAGYGAWAAALAAAIDELQSE